jgi:serine acetyltransferase/GT2 family glycosyltransferase
MAEPKVSVVVATYNRLPSLLDTLRHLAAQTLAPDRFEVVLVDDGSAVPVAEHVAKLDLPYELSQIRQDNAGQAAARQRGVELASGDIVVIVDDDMELPPEFLEAHLRAHEQGFRVALGHIAPPEHHAEMTLFERFHLGQIKRNIAAQLRGEKVRGVHLCTGNVSFRREDFLDVGGFDETLKRSEDRELGIRLEQHGAPFTFAEEAVSHHHSDHEDAGVWMRRAFLYGVYDRRIGKKHEDVEDADPWRFFFRVNPISRPLLVGAIVAPKVAERVAVLGLATSDAVDRAGLERLALAGVTLVYGLQYFRGMREDAGSIRGTLRDLRGYLKKRARAGEGSALLRFAHAVRTDYAAVQRYRGKYHEDEIPLTRLPQHLVQKIGFQMMTATRVMQLFRDAGVPVLPKVASRLIRHLYSAEIHWDTDIAPGVCIVHGNGIVLSHAAKVDEGCILFHNVTLGEGIDPETREVGAPHLEEDVHVGPGVTILGPITVGAGTKIMAGAVLSESVPPDSRVSAGEPRVEVKKKDTKRRGALRIARGS